MKNPTYRLCNDKYFVEIPKPKWDHASHDKNDKPDMYLQVFMLRQHPFTLMHAIDTLNKIKLCKSCVN